MFRHLVLAASMSLALLPAGMASALDLEAPFGSIDGGELALADWRGQPILVVNTASRCGFTDQYSGLQALHERYRDRGLVVLAVPSNDFRQELASDAAVKDFCELQYGIDMPMTTVSRVTGADAHPFYVSVKDETGFEPRWNFNKVLIGPDGRVAATFGAQIEPLSDTIINAVEASLP